MTTPQIRAGLQRRQRPIADAFVLWLSNGLATGAIAHNERGAFVHFTDFGMLLWTPGALVAYVAETQSHARGSAMFEAAWLQVQKNFQRTRIPSKHPSAKETRIHTFVFGKSTADCYVIPNPVDALDLKFVPLVSDAPIRIIDLPPLDRTRSTRRTLIGYSDGVASSSLQAMKDAGLVRRIFDGMRKIMPKKKQSSTLVAPPAAAQAVQSEIMNDPYRAELDRAARVTNDPYRADIDRAALRIMNVLIEEFHPQGLTGKFPNGALDSIAAVQVALLKLIGPGWVKHL